MANWKNVYKKVKPFAKKVANTVKKAAKNTKDDFKHTYKALKQSKKSGGIKNVQKGKGGTQYNYKDGTGYYVGR